LASWKANAESRTVHAFGFVDDEDFVVDFAMRTWMLVDPVLLAVSLMHCRNVEMIRPGTYDT
jgi:hypothetical protein